MPRPSKTWIITDTHWNSDKTVEWANRPADYKERLSRNLQYYVMKHDLLIHLGDVIFKNNNELPYLLAYAPCKAILVRGNHDNQSNGWFMRNGFDLVCDGLLLDKCWLTHKPTVCPDGADVNIHGHFHNNPKERWEKPLYDIWHSGPHVLLSPELTNYKPICLQKIHDEWKKVGNHIVTAK